MSIALDDFALKRARLRAAMQPRNDQTINELPLLSALNTDVVPIWRNGETAQVSVSSIVALTPGTTPQTDLTVYNVKAYGATGSYNGSTGTDDTAAIQSAINAAHAALGGIIYFPPGAYLISAALTIYSNCIVMGAGASALGVFTSGSTIVQRTLNADIFTTGTLAGGAGPVFSPAFRDLNLTYAGGLGSPTGGAAIRLAYCQTAWVERVYISTCYNGIVFGADTASPPSDPTVALWIWVRNCVVAGVVNSAFVVSGNTANLDIQSNLCFGFGGNSGPSVVMSMTALGYCDVLYFRFNDCESFGAGMLLNANSAVAGVSNGIVDSYIEGNIFDGFNNACLQLGATNLGVLGRIKCTSNWFTGSGNTVVLQAAGTGIVEDITFRGNFFSSSVGYGLVITGNAPPADIEVSDNQFYGNSGSSGGCMTIASGARVHVRDNMMSIRAGAPNNFGGINITAGVTDYIIEGNDVRHCASYGISNNAPTQGLARNNPGYNPIGIGTGSPSVPATTGTQGNPFPTDAMVYISSTSTTGLSVVISGYGGGSSAVSQATNTLASYRVPYGGLIGLTYGGTAPTWVWAVD